MNTPNRTELLSPAGTLKSMRYAFAYGADAVYAGQPRYSLRVRNNEFDHANLKVGIDEAHALGKQFYVVVNIAPHNAKLKTFIKDLEPVVAMGPDALIMSDPGLIMLVRQHYPQMPIHLSVQANAVNWASVEFWRQQGLSRVILSRELALEEIEEIRSQVPGMELEVFVHGALCMAYSGRCLLSGYINKRDPNQGTCTNACRWEYKTHEAKEDELGNSVHLYEPIAVQQVEAQGNPTLGVGAPTDKVFLLEDVSRPGEFMEATEDEHGTYIMNSKDLRAVQHVERLVQMGVHSLKIEGRTKSHYYVARTAQVYRKAIDDALDVVAQVGGAGAALALAEVDGQCHPAVAGGLDRFHLAQAHAGIEAGRDDVELFVADGDIERDAGMGLDEAREQRAGEETLGDRGRGDPQQAAWRAVVVGGFERGIQRGQRLRDLAEEPLAGFGEAHAARGALHQGHAQAVFQPADALADGGPGDAEAVAGLAEVVALGYGAEQTQQVEIELHGAARGWIGEPV